MGFLTELSWKMYRPCSS